MAIISIKERKVNIDIAAELSEYSFGRERWTADKLIASSPFRDDQTPSFFVNLSGEYAGTYGDSGALDEEYRAGNFASLVAHLRGLTYDEACDYLLDKYGALYEIKPDEPIQLPAPELTERQAPKPIEPTSVTQATSPYLLSRGISADVQALYGVGYGADIQGHTAIPWHTPEGRLANVKYRSTKGKRFFFEKGATPVGTLVYGIDLAGESAVIVEGEIDAMSFRVAGVSAVALGGAYLSDKQADILRRSGIRQIYLGGDNDKQGAKLNEQVERAMRGYARLYRIDYGKEKDANAVLTGQGVDSLKRTYEQAEAIPRLIRPAIRF